MPWDSPFAAAGHWFKGNLHTHSTQSDGALAPEEVLAWYRGHGYDFVALSDHWVLTRGRDLGDMITLSAAELHDDAYHMLALGLRALPDRALAPDPAALAAAVRANGGLPFFAHPRWVGQTSAQVRAVPGIAGVEVYNSVCDAMDGLGDSSTVWDEALARGARLLGLAVDDTHWRRGEAGRGYVMVRATQLNEAGILDALRAGRYYSSSGPRIDDLRLVTTAEGGPALRVRCSPCQSITFYTAGPRGVRHVAAPRQAREPPTQPLPREQVYVRVECRDVAGGVAWSNPLYYDQWARAELA
jgi:hypothetical protein